MASPSNDLLFSHKREEEAFHVVDMEQAPRNIATQTKQIKNGKNMPSQM